MRCPKCQHNKSSVIDSRQAEDGNTIRRNHDGEVDSDVIGNLVMKELADLDEITYVRFASVYRSFKDVDEIEELLQEITKTVRAKKESKK